jgi:hypothetical protein
MLNSPNSASRIHLIYATIMRGGNYRRVVVWRVRQFWHDCHQTRAFAYPHSVFVFS